ncbi:hypothetical protein MMC26_001646 [Xylographa opegraphella]|nr:hypothetical protein [Xylographa opegraphella]
MIALTFQFGAALAILISTIDARAIHKPVVRDAQQAFSTMDVGVFSGIFPPGYSIGTAIGTNPPNGPGPLSTVDMPAATSIDPIPTPPAGTGHVPVPTPSEAATPISPAPVDTPIATPNTDTTPTPPAVIETPPAVQPQSMPDPPTFSTGMPLFPTGVPVFPTGMPVGPTAPAVMSVAPPQTAEAVAAINTTSVVPGGVFISVPYMTVTVTVTASPACEAPPVVAIASLSTPAGIFGPGTGTAVTPILTPSMPDSSPMPTGAMPELQPNPPEMMSAMTIEVPVPMATAPAPIVPSLGTGLPPPNAQPTASVLFGNSTLPASTPEPPPGQPLTPIGTAPGPLRTLTDFGIVTKTIEELAAITTLTIA